MRRSSRAAVIGMVVAAAAGCGGEDFGANGDADDKPVDTASGSGVGGAGGEDGTDGVGGSQGVAGHDGAGGAGGAGEVNGCDPKATPEQASCVIDDEFGVFVRTEGDDAASGTKAAPVRTLTKAIELASTQNKRVYACAQTFGEAIVVPGGVEVYGGFACATDWSWKSGDLTRVEAPAAVAIHVTGGSGKVRLVDLLVTAADASTPGGSSMAVYADGVDAEIERCQLFAGNGAAGKAGVDASSNPASSGVKGNAGTSACLADVNAGGAKRTSPLCTSSSGGAGGLGSASFGWSGMDGLPALSGGQGGTGQSSSGTWSCFTAPLGALPYGAGSPGASESAAPAGLAATSFGVLQPGVGYLAADGHDGVPGSPGQGGGGGGGAVGVCGPDAPKGGAGGGGGGSGGCGGSAGGGGRGGGSSIAVAIRTATVKLDQVALFTKNGAAGGNAGRGQPGGVGGDGGNGGLGSGSSKPGCPGGKGGNGGHGGPGSGGAGGHSIGVLHLGSPPQMNGVTFTLGAAGPGGPGVAATADSLSGPGGPAGKIEEIQSL